MRAVEKKPLLTRSIRVRGLVQGVGFRPMVWRLAHEHDLSGQVLNDGEGVLIDVCGQGSELDAFVADLPGESPPLARIDSIEQYPGDENSWNDFRIVESKGTGVHTGVVPDAATCADCVADTLNPANRRYRYPFTNCTHCGPRLSIVNAIPYDRANTSMAPFIMCPQCQAEYDDPADRRFHAQPNACPVCGPQVWLEPACEVSDSSDVIDTARNLLQQGKILAIKGIGGFHLACDATNAASVALLRERKHRYAKPLALMAWSLDVIQRYCRVDKTEAALLATAEAPIVLLQARPDNGLAPEIAPGQSNLGFMLPYTPLHHLLLAELEQPLVMTSGNLSDAPQCIDNNDAKQRLGAIVDYWLLHDREIRNRVDDSVVRVVDGKTQILRRGRGYAPTPIRLPAGFENCPDLLALGGELKNTFCLVKDSQAVLSQHMGDLENAFTYADYEKNLDLYQRLFRHQPAARVIDAHPEYLSSKLGRALTDRDQLPLHEVHHHHAHIAACLAENNWPVDGPRALGIALDGLGYGQDGTIWGGEFLLANYQACERLASFKPVALIGGGKAMLEPWRNTYAHLVAAIGWEQLLTDYAELELVSFLREKPHETLNAMLEKGINSPLASSCGRLFDAVSAAVGLCREIVQYEGQAAMELESLVDSATLKSEQEQAYALSIETGAETGLAYLEPRRLFTALLNDLKTGTAANIIATRFHLGLAKSIINMALQLCTDGAERKTDTIVLSGGVFQNLVLFKQVKQGLKNAGYRVLSHSQVPANDGGVALGQAVIALARSINTEEKQPCA